VPPCAATATHRFLMTTTRQPHTVAGQGRAHVRVLRAVASLELSKGLVVLLAAGGIVLLIHRNTSDVAYGLLRLLHISPDHRFAQIFLHWANGLTDKKLWAIAGVSAIYSVLRFVEAYGLWKAAAWAEWIALVSGAIYLPFEIHEILRRQNLFNFALLFVNLAVVLYMAYLRIFFPDETAFP
jgi:uncharacterized membrane protein (DUF2068 family)